MLLKTMVGVAFAPKEIYIYIMHRFGSPSYPAALKHGI